MKFIFLIFNFSFLIFVFSYPLFAVRSYYGTFQNYQGLYGLNFLRRTCPEDYQAILWLKKNIAGQPTVLEAAGDSYTLIGRVSSFTGLPTVQGWLVHEWLWRGSFAEPGQRAEDVAKIYETENPLLARSLLRKYQVQYVFIGSQEEERYQVSEQKFSQLGQLVYSLPNTRIYQIPQEDKK